MKSTYRVFTYVKMYHFKTKVPKIVFMTFYVIAWSFAPFVVPQRLLLKLREDNSSFKKYPESNSAYGRGVFFFQSVRIQEINANKYKNI